MTHPNVKHGMYGTPTYNSWAAMRQRCEYPGAIEYKRYGARGIRVCERWKTFANFLEDMGVRPAGATLDRIDSNGNYEPGNCRWASKKVQANNCSANTVVEYDGKKLTIAQWADRSGLPASVISKRLRRGWSAKDSLSLPLGTNIKPRRSSTQFKPKLITFNGETRSMEEWALHLGFANGAALAKRFAKGLPLEVVLSPPMRKQRRPRPKKSKDGEG